MRTWCMVLALVVLGVGGALEAKGKVPLKRGVIPPGEGWSCTRDADMPEHITDCFRSEEECNRFKTNATRNVYGNCRRQKVAACLTYRKKLDGEYSYECHESFKSCKSHREWYLTEQKDDADTVSDCEAVK